MIVWRAVEKLLTKFSALCVVAACVRLCTKIEGGGHSSANVYFTLSSFGFNIETVWD